jgi:cytosine permease
VSRDITTAKTKEHEDADYTFERVPKKAWKSFGAMFVIMLGFTFFSASMWTGVSLANGLNFGGFMTAVMVGGLILSVYTGVLGYIGSDTRLSFDLLCRRAFGLKGSYLPSAMIALTQIGWFGVGAAMFAIPAAGQLAAAFGLDQNLWTWILVILCGACMTTSAYFGIKGIEVVSWISCPLIAILGTVSMVLATKSYNGGFTAMFGQSAGSVTLFSGIGMVIGSFVSGGTATPNFSRFAKDNKSSVVTTVFAFLIGNTLMFLFGGVAGAATGQNDIFYVMITQGAFMGAAAFVVLGANIWTTNDNALYTGAMGLSNITKVRKRPMVIVAGVLGTVLAVWLYNNFCNWLTILNASLPCVGAVIAVDYFRNREKYRAAEEDDRQINWAAIAAVAVGFAVGNLTAGNFIKDFTWGIAAINNMASAVIVYLAIEAIPAARKEKAENAA